MPLYPSQLASRFDYSVLHGQFVLSRENESHGPGWDKRTCAGWTLAAHTSLPVADVRDKTGQMLGWILGYAVAADGHLVHDSSTCPVTDPNDIPATFEQFLYEFGGRFAAILLTNSCRRVYLDPFGSLSMVYCESSRMVASTPSLIPYTDSTQDNTALIDALAFPESNAFFPFGLTPRRGIARLLPNHFLDLDTWRMIRHWPLSDPTAGPDVASAPAAAGTVVRTNIEAVAREHEVYLSLTAGRDSRMVLACARDFMDKISLFTFGLPDRSARIDVDVARRMASKLSLRHEILPFDPPSQETQDLWFFRSGCAIAEKRGRQALGGYARLDSTMAELPALGLEILRDFYMQGNTAESSTCAADLLRTMNMPEFAELSDSAERWLSGVPSKNRYRIDTLLYVENRLGCWAGLLPYADPVSTAFRLYPSCHRRIVEISLSVPPEYRNNHQLADDIIRNMWPALMQFPVNRFPGIKHYKTMMVRRMYLMRQALKGLVRRRPQVG